MKSSQILAAGALLAGYVQACTRIRVDQVTFHDLHHSLRLLGATYSILLSIH
jgi:hypothetical protein